MIRRRDFMTLLGGAAAVWPMAAWAQQPERMRRIGILSQYPEAEARANTALFRQRLQELGWIEGRNIEYELRWSVAGLPADRRRSVMEIVALRPDLILASAAVIVEVLQEQTRAIPIVFAGVIDPVGGGLVAGLARPGGNATGFMEIEYSIGGKWLQLLTEIAPNVRRVAVFRATTLPGTGQFGAIQGASALLGVEVSPVFPRDPGEIERAIVSFAREPNGGLIVTAGGLGGIEMNAFIPIAAKHRLPAVYFDRLYVAAGGMLSYGPVTADQYRRAAEYADRILRGEKPADLPVQAPTKYELAINLKTVKALGLTVPPTMLLRADEVIE
jgi:putative ABC transport system substrate-binding protein